MASNTADKAVSYYRLREQPFAPTADPEYFYASASHRECLVRLWDHIDGQHGIAVVSGGYGSGKTTLMRKVLLGMRNQPARYQAAVIAAPLPAWTTFDLLEQMVRVYQLQPPERSYQAYMEALYRHLIAQRDTINTLIVDDAQNLNKKGQLEVLRLAQNLETAQQKLLNLVFFAQNEWLDMLQAVPQFAERISCTSKLGPWTQEDLERLIHFRLKKAGSTSEHGPVFDKGALRCIHAYSEGNPRTAVNLSRNALLIAAQDRVRRIGPALILRTVDKTALPNEAKRQRLEEVAWEYVQRSEIRRHTSPTPGPVPPSMLHAPAARMSGEQRADLARHLLLRESEEQTGE